jgi:hypothetical protein
MSNQSKNPRSFLARFLSSKDEKVAENNFADFQEFRVWKEVCEQILAKPFPPQSSEFPSESLERDNQVTFANFPNWEIVCQEILDTEHSHIYYEKCYEELRKRGKSETEIFEMRRFAWQTAGWLNFPMLVWDWVSLDESDIFRAIEWLYHRKQISLEQRIEFENFVKLHA